MEQNKSWLKFIITGKIDDYLTYKQNSQKQQLNGGGEIAHYNRRIGDQGNKYQG